MKGIKINGWALLTDEKPTEKTIEDLEKHGFKIARIIDCNEGAVILVEANPYMFWEDELR